MIEFLLALMIVLDVARLIQQITMHSSLQQMLKPPHRTEHYKEKEDAQSVALRKAQEELDKQIQKLRQEQDNAGVADTPDDAVKQMKEYMTDGH